MLLYKPIPTSYDYDAPLTEAGDTGTKFHILRETISKHEKIPVVPIPSNTTKFDYGKVQMTRMSTFLDAVPKLAAPHGSVNASFPLNMEQIGQNYGFVLYRTQIPKAFSQSSIHLTVASLIRYRNIVYVGQVRQATMFRRWNQSSVMLQIGHDLQLDILVENTGRVNAGPRMADPKGILGNVTIGGTLLMNWQMYPINLGNVVSKLPSLKFSSLPEDGNNNVPTTSDDTFAPSMATPYLTPFFNFRDGKNDKHLLMA